MNLAFFASHNGSNMQAVLDACESGVLKANPCLLICNNPGAAAMQRAQRSGVPQFICNAKTHPDAGSLDRAILDLLERHETDLILLAGYMKRLGPLVVDRFRNRILNIHPSLLPKFGGQGMYGAKVHAAVLAARERETGVSIHLVDEEYDHGAVIAQTVIPILSGDTVESLGARVLRREHEFLAETLVRIERREIALP